ncbi:putative uncharacterized protein [Clostridium sp. CAG:710]|nr:putative uncharacterized protein [Clostridium sp. CAG:710]
MKKIRFILFSLFIMLLPIFVYADGTTRYYIEVNVLDNGDAEVKELKLMDGEYNGYKTDIRYKSNGLTKFDGSKSSFEGSDIYNASALTDVKVYDVKFTTTDFSIINNKNREFVLVNSAEKGDYGVYTKTTNSEGIEILSYQPSVYKRASLVTYTLKDLVVVHNDIAELAHDFIGTDYQEDISNLIIRINLPSSSKELRIFSHGPLNGKNRIIDDKSVEITYETLYKENAVDGRVVFDKSIVPNATKKSNVDGLGKILEVEKERANYANKLREAARKREKMLQTLAIIMEILLGIWLIGLIVIVYKFYNKNDKEYRSEFNGKYFRDFPEEYTPSTVSYLMNKSINNLSFNAGILDLIRKKAITIEEVTIDKKGLFKNKQQKDYKLSRNMNFNLDTLSTSEKKLFNLLIGTVGNGDYVILGDMKEFSKDYNNAKRLISGYDGWRYACESEAETEEFYENTKKEKTNCILYSLIFIPITFLALLCGSNMGRVLLMDLFGILAIIYFSSATKRTKKGNEQYHKWKGLKNFLADFGRLDEKDLPEIKLWERYLVYATMFGLAVKVQNAMKMNLERMNYSDNIDFTYLYFDNYYFSNSMTNAVNSSFSSARGTISTHELASSSDSSSGGYGGGSSFGGGGFGGGSGGGRF